VAAAQAAVLEGAEPGAERLWFSLALAAALLEPADASLECVEVACRRPLLRRERSLAGRKAGLLLGECVAPRGELRVRPGERLLGSPQLGELRLDPFELVRSDCRLRLDGGLGLAGLGFERGLALVELGCPRGQ
jgi:hypothetical protein